MKFEELWDKYINQSALSIYDDALEFFSRPIDPALEEEYDLVEMVLEINGHHETAKEFDKCMKFVETIREKNPDLHRRCMGYLYMDLVDVYAFQQMEDRVKQVLSDLSQSDPIEQFDELMLCLKKSLYYGYVEAVDEVCQQIYQPVKETSRLIAGAEEDLAIFHIYHTMQLHYQQAAEQNQSLDWEALKVQLEAYDFNQEDDFIQPVKEGLFPADEVRLRDQLPTRYRQNEEQTLLVLQMCFMRYMLQQGMPFAISIGIWAHLMAYWQKYNRRGKGKDTLGRFFYLENKTFREYVSSQQGLMLDYRFYGAVILWGSLYVYGFLYQQELIDQHGYQRSVDIIRETNKRFLANNVGDFWQFDFVHRWVDRPDSMSEEEWEEEKKLFAQDYHVERKRPTINLDPEVGNPMTGLMDAMYKLAKESYASEMHQASFNTPLRKAEHNPYAHLNRNDRITVRYQDGRLVKDIKFKKVEADLKAGKCELVE